MSNLPKIKISPYGTDEEEYKRKEFDQARFACSVAVFARDLLADKIKPVVERLADCERQLKLQDSHCLQRKSEIGSHCEKLKASANKSIAGILAACEKSESTIDAGVAASDWKPAESYYAGIEENVPEGLSRRIDHVLKAAAWINNARNECEASHSSARISHRVRLANLASIATRANQSCTKTSATFIAKKLQPVRINLVVKDPGKIQSPTAEVFFDESIARCNQMLNKIELTEREIGPAPNPDSSPDYTMWGCFVVFIGLVTWVFVGVLLESAEGGLLSGAILVFFLYFLKFGMPSIKINNCRSSLESEVLQLAELLKSAATATAAMMEIEKDTATAIFRGTVSADVERLGKIAETGSYAVTKGLPADKDYLYAEIDKSDLKRREQIETARDRVHQEIESIHEECNRHPAWLVQGVHDWHHAWWSNWSPTESRSLLVAVGQATPAALDSLPKQSWPSLPVFAPFAEGLALVLKFTAKDRDYAANIALDLGLRLLAANRPGGVRFTFVDPQYLGRTVDRFHRLADHEPLLISGRCFTDERGITRRLDELIDHIESVTRQRLRDVHADIDAYNAANPAVPEPYHVAMLFDFPEGLTTESCNRLLKVIRNGPRCGVHVILHWAEVRALPYQVEAADIERVSRSLKINNSHISNDDARFEGWRIQAYTDAPSNTSSHIVGSIGNLAASSIRVVVPFETMHSSVFGDFSRMWKGNTTSPGIEIPLGPAGSQAHQMLRLGAESGLEHHALIVGRPGSGKSNLMHVIIAGMALKYSPKELELYLVDFKGGVEFKPYGTWRLPHARAVAVESEREFGISILRCLGKEMGDRETKFRKAHVNDLPSYRSAGHAMSRVVLLVDEFQDFFSRQDALATEARQLFDQIVRKGRSAGIHIILGSQSLSGSQTLLPTTINLMTIRIALQCSDADSRVILAMDNVAAKSLTRPGEGIYNNMGGLPEGNHNFQVARLRPDILKTLLPKVREHAEILLANGDGLQSVEEPIIFEGNEAPALQLCAPLRKQLAILVSERGSPASPKIWIGEPIEILPPVEVSLDLNSTSHLLLVTRNGHEGMSLCAAAAFAMIAQFKPDDLQIFHFAVSNVNESPPCLWEGAGDLVDTHRMKLCLGDDIPKNLIAIRDEVVRRQTGGSQTRILVLMEGLQDMRGLRKGFGTFDVPKQGSAAEALGYILANGGELGVHVIASVDSVSSLRKYFDDRLMTSFGARMAGPMTEGDSQRLLGSSAAAKIDKPHRLCMFSEDAPGQLTLLRPYRFESASDLLSQLKSKQH